MGRFTVYNEVYTPELWKKVSKKNKTLLNDFLDYKTTSGKSPKTIEQYFQMIRLFFCWNYLNNDDTFFVDLKKRQFIKFFNYLVSDSGCSPNRVATIKSTLSSLSNYIEDILDDEYENYRNIVTKLEIPVKQPVRKKTILTDKQIEDCLEELLKRKKYQQACYLALAISSGARKAELLQFKHTWFTDENIMYGCMWRTPETIRTKGAGVQGKQLKKFTFINTFQKYFDAWMEYRKELGIENEYLFVVKSSETGEWSQAKAGTANRWCEQISEVIGTDFYSHCARHYYVTHMKSANLPNEVIISLVGWTSDMVGVYDDRDKTELLADYFDENGIREVKEGKITDL